MLKKHPSFIGSDNPERERPSIILTKPVEMGQLGAAHGVHGWLKILSYTERPEKIFDYQPWYTEQASVWRRLELESWKRHKQALIIKIKDVEDRNRASLLTHRKVIVDVTQLPPLETGNYYWSELLGSRVITTVGYQMGTVTDVMETGSNDVLVVRAEPQDIFGIQDRLIPFLNERVVKHVDLANQVIAVDWDPAT
jgi:16S rRNA processing protein RimM